jgi:hypothetical protein
MKQKTYLTAMANNNKYCLLRIQEDTNSFETHLIMPRSKYTINFNGVLIEKITDFHISIHPCSKSKEAITVKSTQKNDNKTIVLYHVDPGIKRNHLFV